MSHKMYSIDSQKMVLLSSRSPPNPQGLPLQVTTEISSTNRNGRTKPHQRWLRPERIQFCCQQAKMLTHSYKMVVQENHMTKTNNKEKERCATDSETNPSMVKSMHSPGFSSKREGVMVNTGLWGSGGSGLL